MNQTLWKKVAAAILTREFMLGAFAGAVIAATNMEAWPHALREGENLAEKVTVLRLARARSVILSRTETDLISLPWVWVPFSGFGGAYKNITVGLGPNGPHKPLALRALQAPAFIIGVPLGYLCSPTEETGPILREWDIVGPSPIISPAGRRAGLT